MADPYVSPTDDELVEADHAFRPDLYAGKVVLVTGGAGGIGRAICLLLGRLGARLVVCGRTEDKLTDVVSMLARHQIDATPVSMTIRDPEQVAELIDKAWQVAGRLDVLVNNAGGQFAAPATEITPKGWRAVIDTNLNGQWYMMQAAAQAWIEHNQPGSIVNIGTITGRASIGIAHTAAARAGAAALAGTLSVEWAPHDIRINTVAVGVVQSPGLVNYPPEARPSFDHNPQRRLGSVHDVAQTVAFLGSPIASGYITGDVVHVAGGGQIWGEYWSIGKPDYFKIDE